MIYDQDTELLLLDGILSYIDNTFIDVGAEKGVLALWLLARGFSGVVCEPLPHHGETLRALAARAPVTFLPFAIDATDGERDFYLATDDHGQPLDHFHSLQRLQGDTRVHHATSIKVRCRSLSSLAQEGLVPATPGLLIVDTEGHDLHVLRGLGAMRPAAIMTEFFTEGVYQGWPDAHPDKLVELARQIGYSHFMVVRRNLNTLERVEYCPLVIAPREWGNLLFLRDDIFPLARSAWREIALQNQIGQNTRWNDLFHACEERLALLNSIHAEAEKRLSIINQLTQKQIP